MNRKKKLCIYVSYLIVLLFSCWSILQKPLIGGPCNAGIDLIILAPVGFIISILQFGFLNHAMNSVEELGLSWSVFSLSLTITWIFFMKLYYDGGMKSLLFHLPFLLLNIFVTVFLLLYRPVYITNHD